MVELSDVAALDFNWRAYYAQLCLIQAAVLVRLGNGPASAEWPREPFHFQPLGVRRTNEGIVVFIPWDDLAADRQEYIHDLQGIATDLVVPDPR